MPRTNKTPTVANVAAFLRTELGMTVDGGNGTIVVRDGKIIARQSFFYYGNADLHAFHNRYVALDGSVYTHVLNSLGVRLEAAGEIDPDTGKPDGARVVEKNARVRYYEITLAIAA